MGSGSSAPDANTRNSKKDKDRPKDSSSKKDDPDDKSRLSDIDETDESDNYDSDGSENNKDRDRKRQRGRKSKPADGKREEWQRELKSIARSMISHPPDRVPNSESYRTSLKEYQKVLLVQNKEVLDKVFDKELWALREHTISEIYAAEKTNVKTTREALLSEYKLKLCALVNCYKAMKTRIDEERMRLELEKLEDMKFLSKMHDRVENGEMTRGELVMQLDRYGNDYRAKQSRYSDGSTILSDGGRSATSRQSSSKLGMSAGGRRGGALSSSGVGMNIFDDEK